MGRSSGQSGCAIAFWTSIPGWTPSTKLSVPINFCRGILMCNEHWFVYVMVLTIGMFIR